MQSEQQAKERKQSIADAGRILAKHGPSMFDFAAPSPKRRNAG